MGYLISGLIILLVGIGLMRYGYSLLGIILVLIGGAMGVKGRRKLDNSTFAAPKRP